MPWTEDTKNSLPDPYKTEVDGDKIDQYCSAYRQISFEHAGVGDVSGETDLHVPSMTIEAGVTYTVQTGYKLWTSDAATSPIAEADGTPFELMLMDSAFYMSTGLMLLTYLNTI